MLRLPKMLFVAFLISLLSSPAFGWGCTPHMVIELIAFSRLKPEVAARVKRLGLSLRVESYIYDHTSMACYMDDVRALPFYDYARTWHVINKPFWKNSSSNTDGEHKLPGVSTPNLLTQIETIIQEFYKRRNGTAEPSDVTEAELLAYLVHMVGDAHQPLHCAELFSDEFPKGDLGGNRFPIFSTRKTLHAYWDEAGGLFGYSQIYRSSKGNFSPADKSKIETFAKMLMSKYPTDDNPKSQDMNPASWIDESYDIARKEVYVWIEPRTSPTKEYEAKTQAICGRRIARAGYRLAALLNQIYAISKEAPQPK
jgi:hypothetical protein